MRNPISFLLATLLGLSLTPACKTSNPDYCANNSACKTQEAPICDPEMKSCRGCENTSDCLALDPATPACVGGQCVACGVNADCKAPTAPFCDAASNECRGCSGGTECAAVDSTKPVCLATRTCAECDKDADCKSGDKPICDPTTKSCRGCAASAECGAGVCGPSGACVGCVANADCKVAEQPYCDPTTNTCRGCQASAECNAATPVCLATGVCVECNISSDCKGATKPVCNSATHTCRACQADLECPGDPGVCMKHVDGHCAVASESIYVRDEGAGTCYDAPPAPAVPGTKDLPVCSLQAGLALVTAARPLVVVRGEVFAGEATTLSRSDTVAVTIVGQNTATATALSTVLSLTSGTVYVRGLKLKSAFDNGLTATGGTLRLDGVTIDGCPGGGILLDGAGFDIRNTTVTKNGTSGGTISGIEIRKVPSTGPASLTNVTATDNSPYNLSCGAVIMGQGVLAPGAAGGACGIASCVTASPSCGAF